MKVGKASLFILSINSSLSPFLPPLTQVGNILTVLSPISPALTQELVPITPKSSNALRAHCTSNRVNNCGLSIAERTGSPVFHTQWSYVIDLSGEGLL